MFPYETLTYGKGDCDDHANLALSLFKSEQNVAWAWCAHIRFANGEGHIAIFINVEDDKLSIYDPTNDWTDDTSYSEPEALSRFGAIFNTSIEKIAFIFNGNVHIEFDDLQDFFDTF